MLLIFNCHTHVLTKMYGFTHIGDLKQKVGNKAHLGSSICNAYLIEEISTFVLITLMKVLIQN